MVIKYYPGKKIGTKSKKKRGGSQGGPFSFLFTLILGFWLVGAAGCSISKRDIRETAQDYYIFGTQVYKTGDYTKAQEAFQKILNEYPDSDLRRDALLNLADSYYGNEEYEEARFQYLKFLELYPEYPHSDTVMYRMAMSSFLRTRPDNRDQSITQEAIRDFETFLLTHPQSQHFRDVLRKIIYCKNKLAAHELGVGKFYFRQGAYHAAISRFDRLLKTYPAIYFRDEVLFYQGESYLREESREKAAEVFQTLISQFPDSSFAKEAQKRMVKVR